jgi:hypothetical protein
VLVVVIMAAVLAVETAAGDIPQVAEDQVILVD